MICLLGFTTAATQCCHCIQLHSHVGGMWQQPAAVTLHTLRGLLTILCSVWKIHAAGSFESASIMVWVMVVIHQVGRGIWGLAGYEPFRLVHQVGLEIGMQQNQWVMWFRFWKLVQQELHSWFNFSLILLNSWWASAGTNYQWMS